MISFLRDFVQHDFLLKVFSLALAVLIWFTVTEMQKEASPLPRLTMNSDVKTFSNLPVVVMSAAQDVRSFSRDWFNIRGAADAVSAEDLFGGTHDW